MAKVCYNHYMFEVELKARISDIQSVKANLSTFASYKKHIDKSDEYFHLDTTKNPGGVTVRFRRETYEDGTQSDIFCYKRKEMRDGVEVNDERETVVLDSYPILTMLTDAGFAQTLKKHKISDLYTYQTPYGLCNIEICNVETLGDFLEIEILTSDNDESLIASIKGQIRKILFRCGIEESAIEPRYYKELLLARGV